MLSTTYSKLPDRFFERVEPTKVSNPSLIKFNSELAKELNLIKLEKEDLAQVFSGNKLLEGSEPLAPAYAGHQFGNFVPQLGDGRAILLGEVIDKNGQWKDIQLKGSGRTSFSRGGDGRAWLGPVIREYLVSEAMYALGVPTTRSLAAVLAGEDVYRETVLPGAVLTRVASSHIRVGTFEYFAARRDDEAVKLLADYVIDRHYPEIKNSENQYLDLFLEVGKRQTGLIANWMSLGFIHGVMNTDNTSICGETIDYGPCAFMDSFDYHQVFSSIDAQGRYSYSNQANICLWNLSSFANTLIPLIDDDAQLAVDACNEVLQILKLDLQNKISVSLLQKIGLEEKTEVNLKLSRDWLLLLAKYRADFTMSFRLLSALIKEDSDLTEFLGLFDKTDGRDEELLAWLVEWRKVLEEQGIERVEQNMNAKNPVFIPRNYLIEEAITQAHLHNDYSVMNSLSECFKDPYVYQEEFARFMAVPENKDQAYVTYCGT